MGWESIPVKSSSKYFQRICIVSTSPPWPHLLDFLVNGWSRLTTPHLEHEAQRLTVRILEFETSTERRLDLFKGCVGAIDRQEKLSGILDRGCNGRRVLLELQTRHRHEQSTERKIDMSTYSLTNTAFVEAMFMLLMNSSKGIESAPCIQRYCFNANIPN